jgi:hypothetical protein
MANEDHIGKYVPVWNPTTATMSLFRLYKEADVYQGGLAEPRKQWPGVNKRSNLEIGDDDESDEEMDAKTFQSQRAEREKSLLDSIEAGHFKQAFKDSRGLDTSKLTAEQRHSLKRKNNKRARFDGNLREAKGTRLCFVAVLTSCLPYKTTTKTWDQEETDKRHRETKVGDGDFLLYKTIAKVLDESCATEPLPMHFFSKDSLGLPSPLPDCQVRLIALYKARVSYSSRTGESYLSASDYSSWVVCSLSGTIIERAGKKFTPPSESLAERLLLARKIQSEIDDRLLRERAARECVGQIVCKVSELSGDEHVPEPQVPPASPHEALPGVDTGEELRPSPLKWVL